MTTIKSSNVTWLDIKNPSPKELRFLAETHNLHPIVLDELEKPTVRSQAEDHNGYIYLVLHFPIFNSNKKISEPVEIDIVITPDTLISIRYIDIEPLDSFLQKCKSPIDEKRKAALSKDALNLFYFLMKEMYAFSLRELDHIEEKIGQIEEGIFSGKEKEMLFALSLARSDILNFLRTIKPQNTLLESLMARDFFESKTKSYYITDLMGEYQRIVSLAENNRDVIEGLQTTNESLLNAKTNQIMKVLTIINFTILPLSLMASIFGVSSKNIPLVDRPDFFWIMLITMIGVISISISIFKYKKWL